MVIIVEYKIGWEDKNREFDYIKEWVEREIRKELGKIGFGVYIVIFCLFVFCKYFYVDFFFVIGIVNYRC